jgi:hypothetical protein
VAGVPLAAVKAGAVAAGCVCDAGVEEEQAGKSSMPASASQASIFKYFNAFFEPLSGLSEQVF